MSDKIINIKCICGVALPYTNKKQIMVEPCEHILHHKCLRQSLKKNGKCPLCKTEIVETFTLEKLKERRNESAELYQKYVDMIATSNFNHLYKVNDEDSSKIYNIIDAIGMVAKIPFLSGYDDSYYMCGEVLNILNSKVTIVGLSNVSMKKPKIFISNHTSYLDEVLILTFLKCGFLSSTSIFDMPFGNKMASVIPLLLIDRGKSKNSVDKIKEYVKTHGSICLFSEGIITHPDTIIRFRTGAFHVGFPVHPVVIKYDPVIHDTNVVSLLGKIISNPNMKITIDILPAENPPFDSARIEQVRKKMAKVGNLALSRVSNRDLKD